MLPPSEIEGYVVEDELALAGDGGHIYPAAIGCIQANTDNHIQFNFNFVSATSSHVAHRSL
jgi:hypothetical protein